jgi:hypothetical protein
VVNKEELERERVTLLGVAVGVEKVVSGGRLGYEGREEVVEYAGVVEDVDGSGVD